MHVTLRIAEGVDSLRTKPALKVLLGDRYDAKPLRCPAQVRNAIHYVLFNHKHHTGFGELDQFTSLLQPQAVVEPRMWLLTHSHVRRGPPRRPG